MGSKDIFLKKLFFFLPIYNMLLDIIFIVPILKPYLIGLRFAYFLLFFITLFKLKSFWSEIKIFKILFILIFYLSVLGIYSSDSEKTYWSLLKFSFPLLMLPAGFYIVKTIKDFTSFNISLITTLLLFILNFVFSKIFHLGTSVYTTGDDFLVGNIYASALYTGSILLLLFPVLNSFNNLGFYKKWLITLIMFLTLLVLLLSFRRTAVIAVAIGYTVILIYSKYKAKLILGIFLSIITLFLTFPFYEEIIITRFEARKSRFQSGAIEEEARYKETGLVWNNILSFNEPAYSLFGKELFNTAGNYGYIDKRRVLHIDYNILVNGAGLIGLILYFLIFIKTYSISNKYLISDRKEKFLTAIRPVFLSVLFTSLVISASSGLLSITYRSILFTVIGGYLGFIKHTWLKIKTNNENSIRK